MAEYDDTDFDHPWRLDYTGDGTINESRFDRVGRSVSALTTGRETRGSMNPALRKLLKSWDRAKEAQNQSDTAKLDSALDEVEKCLTEAETARVSGGGGSSRGSKKSGGSKGHSSKN